MTLQSNSTSNDSQILEHIHAAEILIQNAYLDKSMMEHIHTPPEHMMAVFTPLLLPLVLPILVGMIKEWKRFKELKKEKDIIIEKNERDM